MQRIPVDSTDIVSIGYDPRGRVLEIEFKEGRVYQYLEVDPDIHERFMRADSFGQYFNTFINNRYRYKRVGGEAKPKAQALAFVTGNARKFRDLQIACEPFSIELEQLDLPVDEVQAHSAEEIAVKKAKAAYKLAGRPVVVNDAFWNIIALHGFPGGYMSYVTGWFKPEDFLALLAGKQDRTVCLTDTLVYYDGERSKVFATDIWGKFADAPRGDGLPIEQLVVINGKDKTIAEIEVEDGRSSIDPHESIWHDFAKWYNLQRRLGKV